MKKRQMLKLAVILTVFMAGAVLNGCMPRSIKDAAMDLYEEKVRQDRSEEEVDWDEEVEWEEEVDWDGEADEAADDLEDGREDGKDQEAAGNGTGSGLYASFIKEQLEPKYGTGDNTFFSYGFERFSYPDSTYWFANPESASLKDGIIGTCQRDLDKDGMDELLLLYMEGSDGSGDGRSNLCVKVYSEKNGSVTEIGGMSFADCFSGYNSEDYLIGLKDLGDKRLLYAGSGQSIYTWADGIYPQIHVYQYDGSSLKEIYQVETAGSDGSWWNGWRDDLRRLGFDILPDQWNESNLAGESGFEVLAYGECGTIVNEKEMYSSGDSQQYILEHGRIEGGIYGPGSETVQRLNRSMTAYAGGGYTGNTSDYSGEPGGGSAIAAEDNDYILPQSSTRYLTRQDLAGLTKEQLRLARNEIYARHGRKFQTQELQGYFNSKSWYVGTIEPKDFREEYLNVYEKENVKLIQSLED